MKDIRVAFLLVIGTSVREDVAGTPIGKADFLHHCFVDSNESINYLAI